MNDVRYVEMGWSSEVTNNRFHLQIWKMFSKVLVLECLMKLNQTDYGSKPKVLVFFFGGMIITPL